MGGEGGPEQRLPVRGQRLSFDEVPSLTVRQPLSFFEKQALVVWTRINSRQFRVLKYLNCDDSRIVQSWLSISSNPKLKLLGLKPHLNETVPVLHVSFPFWNVEFRNDWMESREVGNVLDDCFVLGSLNKNKQLVKKN